MHVLLLIVSQLVSHLSTSRTADAVAAAAVDDDSESDDELMDVDGQVHL